MSLDSNETLVVTNLIDNYELDIRNGLLFDYVIYRILISLLSTGKVNSNYE